MRKKIIAVILAAVLVVSGCSQNEDKPSAGTDNNTATQTVTETPTKEEPAPATEEPAQPEKDPVTETPAETDKDPVTGAPQSENAKAITMSVNKADGKLSIKRAVSKSLSMGEDETWTIFFYLCGSELDSNGLMFATADVAQMIQAQASDKVRFVIQTGGAEGWANEVFSNTASERWVVHDNDIFLVDSSELRNMGDPATVSDFLKWGVENYSADKMGVIFWDHGCGSIKGACADVLNDKDTLTLSELNTAFSDVYASMTDKFEFIGFDCCIMGAAELANILTTYARYFYASQETESGTGWDYTTIGTFLAQNPGADGAELGKVVADSFYNECAAIEKENECTFSIIDLGKFDEFAIAFNDFCKQLYSTSASALSGIVRGVNQADNFGGNNKSEGYTNMVDIGGIISNCSDYADGSAVLQALNDCVIYSRNGSDHANASGLSIYYPLKVQNSDEIGIFSEICFSPYYLSIVDMISKGYSEEGYDNAALFDEEGNWVNQDCEYDHINGEYFEHSEEEKPSGLISFAVAPTTYSEEGAYAFQFDEQGLKYASDVEALLYLTFDAENIVELGETRDINGNWETGSFVDNFDGQWLALPNGQFLATYVAEITEDYVIYTSPIYLNGERTNIRIRQQDGLAYLEGVWDGIDENGTPSRDFRQLQAGDKIQVMYYYQDAEEQDAEEIASEYVWEEGDYIRYGFLPEALYYYCFLIKDVYGNVFLTDMTAIYADGEGFLQFLDLSDYKEE